MTNATTHTIVGFFSSPAQAKSAVNDLTQAGFSRDQLSIIASDSRGVASGVSSGKDTPNLGPIPETGSTEDVGEKAAIGTLAGAVLGIAALAVPGIGPLLAAGPLAMAITGAAAGAATGGLIGVLTDNGVPKERAEHYSKAISSGSVMVSVHASAEQIDHAADILDRNGAIDIDEPAERTALSDTTTTTTSSRPLPASAVKFDESTGVRAKQRERERHVDVYPGIAGGGPNPNY